MLYIPTTFDYISKANIRISTEINYQTAKGAEQDVNK